MIWKGEIGISCIPLTPNHPQFVVTKQIFLQLSSLFQISFGFWIRAEVSLFYKFVPQSTKGAVPCQENVTYSSEKNEQSQLVWE